MSDSYAFPRSSRQFVIKALPAVAILLFAGHFLYEKASTPMFFALLLLLIFSQATFAQIKFPQQRIDQLLVTSFIALIVVAFISTATSSANYLVPLKFSVSLTLGFVFLSLAFARQETALDKVSLTTYFLVFIPLLFLAILDLKGFRALREFFNIEVQRYFYNATAVLLSIIIPVVFSQVKFKKFDPVYISLGLWIAFIVFSISETAAVMLLVGLALALLPAALKWLIKYAVVASILAMPLMVSAAHMMLVAPNAAGKSVYSFYAARLVLDRLIIWQGYYAEYGGTLWGVGENIMRRVENPVVVDIDGSVETTHPHNAFIQAHVELGLIGAGLLSLFVFWLFVRIEHSENKYREPMVICLALCMLSRVATHSLWSTNATLIMFVSAFMCKLLIDHLDPSPKGRPETVAGVEANKVS